MSFNVKNELKTFQQYIKDMLRDFLDVFVIAYIAISINLSLSTFYHNPTGARLDRRAENAIKQYMISLALGKYHHALIPSCEFEQKRPVMDHGWLGAIYNKRFELISGEDREICGVANYAGEGIDE